MAVVLAAAAAEAGVAAVVAGVAGADVVAVVVAHDVDAKACVVAYCCVVLQNGQSDVDPGALGHALYQDGSQEDQGHSDY